MKARVLIFDDDIFIRNILRTVLSRRGYEVIEFNNPSLFLMQKDEKCQCKNNEMCCDIFITDINMPFINGVEFIKKQKEKGCKVNNIIIISGGITNEIMEDVKKIDCVFLEKPFSLSSLNKTLDKFEKLIDSDRKLINKKYLK